MEKTYSRINFQNSPTKTTPLSATNLNKMDKAIDELDNRSIDAHEDIEILKGRMDTFQSLPEGSTSSDAALADIAVGYDGTVYKDGNGNAAPGEAVRKQIGQLSSEIVDVKSDLKTVTVVTDDIVYTTGQFTSIYNTLENETSLKYGVVKINRNYDKIKMTDVRSGGIIAIWLKRDGKIVHTINHEANISYTEEFNITDIDEVYFTVNSNMQSEITLYKSNIYTKEEVEEYCTDFIKESDITNSEISHPNFSDDKRGYTSIYGSVEIDNDCRYSDLIPVKGGETIRITNALMNDNTCVHIFTTFGMSIYRLDTPNNNATFDLVLPNDAEQIRYCVLGGSASVSTVSYVSDYKQFREDFIPSLYMNGLGSKNDYPVITFVDDDGHANYLTNVKPLLDNYGYKGTLAVIKNEVGLEHCLTLEQLKTLSDAGYDIVSHSASHSEAIYYPSANDNVTEEQIYSDLLSSRIWLDDNGFNSECIVFPYGHYGDKTRKFVLQAIKAGFQFGCNANSGKGNNKKVINTFYLDRVFVINDQSFDKFKSLIDLCVANNGWLILSTHAGMNDEMGDLSLLSSVIDYIHENNIEVMTFKDACEVKKNVCSIGYIGDKSGRLYIGRDGKIYN